MKKTNYLMLIILTAVAFSCTNRSLVKPGGQQEMLLEKEINITVKVPYLLYLPDDYDAKDTWPVMLFLHGAGERGDDISKVKTHGPPKMISKGQKFPFVVVSPQCPVGQGWSIEQLNLLLDDVVKNYKIDQNRIYLTGLSMGGYGSWGLAQQYPHRFAAVVPICGGGNPDKVAALKDLPIWVFHGAKDQVVPLENSQKMVDALKAIGNEVRFTVYPEAGHDSWTESYENNQLYEWLLEQRKK